MLLLLGIELLLAGCAATPQHFPSETATGYVGKSLLDLEMHWSTPWDLSASGDGKEATWRFDQYNLAGCSVTVRTDSVGIIRNVTWTPGCGPKGTGSGTAAGWEQPEN